MGGRMDGLIISIGERFGISIVNCGEFQPKAKDYQTYDQLTLGG